MILAGEILLKRLYFRRKAQEKMSAGLIDGTRTLEGLLLSDVGTL